MNIEKGVNTLPFFVFKCYYNRQKEKNYIHKISEVTMEDSKIFEIFKMNDEEIEILLKSLTEEEKEETIKFLIMFSKKTWQLALNYANSKDQIIKMQDLAREKSDIIIDDLLDRLEKNKLKIYKKNDIMQLMSCESDKALRFLKLAQQTGQAIKIGKEYQITKENLEKFLKQYEGKNLII